MQPPPTLKADTGLLDDCLACFPAGTRVAVEPRHVSWWSPETAQVLVRHGAAPAWADRLGRTVTPLWRTADWGYQRLHEGRGAVWPTYGRQSLGTWARRCAETFEDTEDV